MLNKLTLEPPADLLNRPHPPKHCLKLDQLGMHGSGLRQSQVALTVTPDNDNRVLLKPDQFVIAALSGEFLDGEEVEVLADI